jgi:hypothetical protein
MLRSVLVRQFNTLCYTLIHFFTASFRELGPPDLCHIIKTRNGKDAGSYHYVSGLDVR